jgi:flagellar biosynthesis protein FlhF
MQVQRFRKDSVREALAEARQALGPEALVLATEMVPVRGWRRLVGRREVQVTAGLTPAMSESRPAPTMIRPTAELPAEVEGGQGGQEVVARLRATGVDRGLATEVAAALAPQARRAPSRRALLDALASRLAVLAADDALLAPIEVFIGPPGAGKTTTIAKLAAQVRARDGVRATLVGADGYRVGAVEQLRLFADILGAPFHVARTAADLERAIALAPTPLLVDTAGRSPADRGVRDLFDALSGRPGVRTHLVLSAGTSARDAERILARYAEARPDRVVLTKVDETESLAPLVAVIRNSGLRVSWLGCGQRVPEDLHRASARLLALGTAGETWAIGAGRDGTKELEEPCA